MWISSSLSIRWRSSATAYECLLTAEKMCEATKANVATPLIASSTDGIAARWNLTAVRRESA